MGTSRPPAGRATRERLSCPVRPSPWNPLHRGTGRRGGPAPAAGVSLLEAIAWLALFLLLAAMALPCLLDLKARATTAAAAREFAALFHGLRYRAVSQSSHHAILFERTDRGWTWSVYRDREGNGVRSRDIRRGREERLGGPWLVPSRWPGVDLRVPPGRRPKGPPPARSDLSDGDPVRFGRSDLVSFTPLGTSSSGTLYIGAGDRFWAVVLYGPSMRIRMWERRPSGWVRR